MNKVLLMGRLTRDPEVRYGGSDNSRAIARFAIAVDRRYKDANGNYPTDFINLVAFGKTGEFVEKYVTKGTKVVVEGEIQNNNYEKDGKMVYQDQIVVNQIEFAESKRAASENGNYSAPSAPVSDAGDGFNAIDDGTEDTLPFD